MYVCMYVCMNACMHACMYVCMYVCLCVYVSVYMHGYEHRFCLQNGSINAYVDPFWLDLGVTFGAFSAHFDIILGVLGGSPAILTKSFQTIEKNTSQASS